jgi:hypothetical protein
METRRMPCRALKLRKLAAECRDLARRVSYRPDRERLEAMATDYETQAARLEQAATQGRS